MKIRFEPIPGGGWADNPFFAQTMVLADRIVWTPGKYYYYRQTNPGASTFIKDYHLPFDRLRDMREFLEGQHVSKEIMRVFYSREFDYVTSVIGEYGFDDKNEDVRALIREVFESMDRKEVFLMADRLRPEFLDYYMDFMGDSYESTTTRTFRSRRCRSCCSPTTRAPGWSTRSRPIRRSRTCRSNSSSSMLARRTARSQ